MCDDRNITQTVGTVPYGTNDIFRASIAATVLTQNLRNVYHTFRKYSLLFIYYGNTSLFLQIEDFRGDCCNTDMSITEFNGF